MLWGNIHSDSCVVNTNQPLCLSVSVFLLHVISFTDTFWASCRSPREASAWGIKFPEVSSALSEPAHQEHLITGINSQLYTFYSLHWIYKWWSSCLPKTSPSWASLMRADVLLLQKWWKMAVLERSYCRPSQTHRQREREREQIKKKPWRYFTFQWTASCLSKYICITSTFQWKSEPILSPLKVHILWVKREKC